MKHDLWTTVLDIVSRLVVGYALAYLAVHLDRVKKRQREQERKEKEHSTVFPGHDHARGAAAGKSNGVHSDSDDPSPRNRGRLPDRER